MTAEVLSAEIEAYGRMRSRLEIDYNGEWAVVHGGELIGTYPNFEAAADEAVQRFGAGPYLIRQIGASRTVLPTAVIAQRFKPVSAA